MLRIDRSRGRNKMIKLEKCSKIQDQQLSNDTLQPHMALEHLKSGSSELRIKYTPDFEEFQQKRKKVKYLNKFLHLFHIEIIICWVKQHKINFTCFFLLFNVTAIKFFITNIDPLYFSLTVLIQMVTQTRVLKVEEVRNIGFGIHFESRTHKTCWRSKKRREIILIPRILDSGTG